MAAARSTMKSIRTTTTTMKSMTMKAPLPLPLLRPHAPCAVRFVHSDPPFQDNFSRIINPVGYIKYRMNVIDNARAAYETCAAQFELQVPLSNDLGIERNFQSWFNMTTLHVWMLNARLRGEGAAGKGLTQEIFNHIWLDAELKLHEAGVKKNLSKLIEGLLDSYYGQTLAYDEGLYRGDAILAAALWRNLLVGRNIQPTQLACAVDYTRKQLAHIEQLPLDNVLEGRISFV